MMIDVISTEAVRAALKKLTGERDDQEWPFTREELKLKFKVNAGDDTQKLNFILHRMAKNGEVVFSPDRLRFRYVPEAAPPSSLDERWTRVYRAARVAKGAFTIDHIVKVAAITPAQARDTLERFRRLGYVEGFREDDVIYYRASQLMLKTPEVPLTPKFEKSRLISAGAALAELNRIFLTLDLAAPDVREQVKDQLKILNRRFGVNGESDDSGKD